MIRVVPAAEPEGFDESVRQPGLLALRELAGDPTVPNRAGPKRKHAPDLWTRALPDLRTAYQRTCAYLGLYIHRATGRDTVDHFVPQATAKLTEPELLYEWSNFRYASLDVNQRKGTGPFLDPFEIESDWFELDLATFRVRARVEVTRAAQVQWDHTLRVLNEPTFCEARRWYHERYFGRRLDAFDPETPMSLEVLQVQAPFVARELVRQGRLRGSCQDDPR